MKIDHIAVWVSDIEKMKNFYIKYFSCKAGDKYINKKTMFESYFLSFSDGARLEIMQMPSIPENFNDTKNQYKGLIHFAVQLESRKAVNELTERLENDGYQIAGYPRVTGDGYYESCIYDPEMNRVELVGGSDENLNDLNVNALTDLTDPGVVNNQGYELLFAGKSQAKALVNIPAGKKLRIEALMSRDSDKTGNVIIIGDNIDALKLLRENYSNKIKMIYIDPPYNTSSRKFIFNDNFRENNSSLINKFGINEFDINCLSNIPGTKNHSGWLSFMYPRLKLSADLLTDDGVIFISIDDNEYANLKLICDEIFGENNFIAGIPTVMNLKGNNHEFGFAGTHETTLVYCKNKQFCYFNDFIIDEEEAGKWMEDEKGYYKKGAKLKATGADGEREKRPNLYFPVFIDDNDSIYVTDNDAPPSDYAGSIITLYPVTNGRDMRWRWSKKKFTENKDDVIVSRNGSIGIYKKQRPALSDFPSKKPKSVFYKPEYSSGNGTAEIVKLFSDKVFTNPKPVALLKDLIQIGSSSDSIILDFFAGSGTTAQAVMEVNAKDNGKRKFILVQLDEEIDKSNPGYDFCINNSLSPLISSITVERVKRAGDKLQRTLNSDIDTGYKVFSIE